MAAAAARPAGDHGNGRGEPEDRLDTEGGRKWKLPEAEQAENVSAADANQKLAKEPEKTEEKKPKDEAEKTVEEKKSSFT